VAGCPAASTAAPIHFAALCHAPVSGFHHCLVMRCWILTSTRCTPMLSVAVPSIVAGGSGNVWSAVGPVIVLAGLVVSGTTVPRTALHLLIRSFFCSAM
jgi:hypothetical protein